MNSEMSRLPEVGPYCWVDITQDFQTAVTDLELGELVHDELFGLFEAMSAIEMMDPKMDAGMNLGKSLCEKPLGFDQSVAAGMLLLKDISPSYLIGIIDNSLSCLVTWLEGHSLAQTVFINLYTHQPTKIEDKYLRSFMITLLKIVDVIKDYVNQAAVFEEEDFQPMIYGYRLALDVTDQKALAQIRECEEELKKKIRSTPKTAENGCAGKDTADQAEDITALLVRFRFVRQFYQMLLHFGKKDDKSSSTPSPVTATIEEILKCAQACGEALGTMLNTCENGLGFGENELQIPGFEPQINQRLLPPTFPRYTNIRSRSQSLEYLSQLMGRIKSVCKVKDCGNFHVALDFFYSFSRSQPPPCVLSRSVLQLLYIPLCNRVLGQVPLVEALQEAARQFIAPPALTGGLAAANSSAQQQPKVQECVDQFFLQCVRPMGTLIQIAGHNLARQRDKLAHVLQELAVLQEEADKTDSFLHTVSMQVENSRPHLACFGTWVLFHTLRSMIQFLLAGFELALYSTHEYSYIFWYLYEFLFGWIISAYTRADSFLAEYHLLADNQAASRAAKGKSGANSKRGNAVQTANVKVKKNKKDKGAQGRPYAKDIARCQALQHMCGGYYKVMIALELEGKLRRPKATFDNERVRYEHRFAPFGHLITPPPVPFNQYKEMTAALLEGPDDLSTRASNLYASACRHFHQAATIFDSVFQGASDTQVASLSRVCKTNCVVMRLLAGGHKREGSTLVSFDFSTHPHYPIVKVG